MKRGSCTFREADVRRAVRAVESAGKRVSAVRINPQGGIEIVLSRSAAQEWTGNEWDDELLRDAH